MTPESSASVFPADVSGSVEKMCEDVDNLRRELSQAQEVWQSTLAAEKNHFDELLAHKEMAWREQESEWARQCQAYEQRFAVLKSEFESRLKQTEQHAAHALSELDDAWQR